jgi:hypothetical protein
MVMIPGEDDEDPDRQIEEDDEYPPPEYIEFYHRQLYDDYLSSATQNFDDYSPRRLNNSSGYGYYDVDYI